VPVYEEYVVVDNAGRLQIPPDLREVAGIGDRVTLEVTEEGVLIRPVSGKNGREGATAVTPDEKQSSHEPTEPIRWWRRWSR